MNQFADTSYKDESQAKLLARTSASFTDAADSSAEQISTKTEQSLSQALQAHKRVERASFHTPGHKGRSLAPYDDRHGLCDQQVQSYDLTELPGLDELSNPSGVIQQLEKRVAALWHAQRSFLTINGATAGILAAIIAVSSRGKKFLIPRNAHRSAVHGLVLSGLEPIWYEPEWNSEWQIFEGISVDSVRNLLRTGTNSFNQNFKLDDVAGMLVVSPTYGGALSDIRALAELLHAHDIPLIVDEAHGAHFLPASCMPDSAVVCGADVVVHSLHKTLTALTQTGVVHVCKSSLVNESAVAAALNLIQSSSPSYPLMASIEHCIEFLENFGRDKLVEINELCMRAVALISAMPSMEIAGNSTFAQTGIEFLRDPFHLLIRSTELTMSQLHGLMMGNGVYGETLLGEGVLMMFGLGSNRSDLAALLESVNYALNFEGAREFASKYANAVGEPVDAHSTFKIVQAMSPREAFLMPSEVVSVNDAIGRVAAECIAPCPPGIPVVVPGQLIERSLLQLPEVRKIRVVCEPSQESKPI